MNKRVKYTAKQKEFFVLKFKKLNWSYAKFFSVYKVDRTALKRWTMKYELNGIDGLYEVRVKNKYSAETLVNSVKDYLTGHFTLKDIVIKYNLTSDSVLRNWLKWYNVPTKWKKKVEDFMAREKLSKEFKIKLVLQCIEERKKTTRVAAENNVSAGQLRDWIRAYKLSGEAALEDNRGSKKDPAELMELSEVEILKLKIKELEKELKEVKGLRAIEKKLEELGRRVLKQK